MCKRNRHNNFHLYLHQPPYNHAVKNHWSAVAAIRRLVLSLLVTCLSLTGFASTPTHAADPYARVQALCAKLNSQPPIVVQPTLEDTITIGTYTPSGDLFRWSLPYTTQTVEEEVPGPDGKSHYQEETEKSYYAVTRAPMVHLAVALRYNTGPVDFTVSSGNQTVHATAPAGAPMVTVTGNFSGATSFTIVPSGQPIRHGYEPFDLRYTLGLDHPESLSTGCVVIPALPVAVVYQPPTQTGRGTFDLSDSTGAELSSLSSSTTGNASGGPGGFTTLGGLSAIAHIGADLMALAGPEASTAASVTAGIADLLSVADTEFSKADPTVTTRLEVTSTHTLEVVSTTYSRFYSAPALGPGLGDGIVYLHDATFAFVNHDGEVSFVPLGYRGLTPTLIPAATLLPNSTTPADLSPSVRAVLLSYDPVASGSPTAPLFNTARYADIGEFTQPYTVEQVLGASYTVNNGTGSGTTNSTEINDDGSIVATSLSSANSEFQARTVSTSVDVTGPVDFEIYYDTLMGTFAYRTLERGAALAKDAFKGSSLSLSGKMLDLRGRPLANRPVTLVQGNRRITTLTRSDGTYLIFSKTLRRGFATIIIPLGARTAGVHKVILMPKKK